MRTGDRQRQTERYRQTDRQADKQTETERYRQTDRQKYRQTDRDTKRVSTAENCNLAIGQACGCNHGPTYILYRSMAVAFRLPVDRSLSSRAGTLHYTLQTVLPTALR